MTLGHFAEPVVGFVYKTDVRLVVLGGIKGNGFELGGVALGVDAQFSTKAQ